MATRDEIYTAIRNADKAGDTEAVGKLGAYLQTMDSAPAPTAYDPTETMSGPERVLAGVGRGMMSVARGFGGLVGAVNQADVDEAAKLDSPLLATKGGKAGNVLGTAAVLAPAALIPGANTLAGAAALGGATGALTTEGGLKERAIGAATGAVAGPLALGAGRMIGGALKASPKALSQAQTVAAGAAEKLGFKLSPGYATGSKSLQRVEAALESNPVTSGGFDALAAHNQRTLNQITAKAIGQDGETELSAPVIGKAFSDVGKIYEKVRSKDAVPLDTGALTGKLMNIIDDHAGQYAGSSEVGSNALFRRMSDFAQAGTATREQLASLSSNLGKAIKNQFTSPSGDRAMGSALAQAKDLVDDSLEGALTGQLAKDFTKARGIYRTLMQLTGNTNIVNPSNGNVNGRALASLLQRKDGLGFTRAGNQTDLYNAARFAQAFPKIVGDSGTATRSMGAADYLAALPARVGTSAYLSRPGVAGAQATVNALRGGQNAMASAIEQGALPASLIGTNMIPPNLIQQK